MMLQVDSFEIKNIQLRTFRILTLLLTLISFVSTLVAYFYIENENFVLINLSRTVFSLLLYFLSYKLPNFKVLQIPLILVIVLTSILSWSTSSFNGVNGVLSFFYLMSGLLVIQHKYRLMFTTLMIVHIAIHLIYRILHPNVEFYNKPDEVLMVLNLIAVLILYTVTYVMLFYFNKGVKDIHQILKNKEKQLAINNIKLEKQSTLLHKSNLLIKRMNESLEEEVEERVHEIKEKNRLMMQYAHMNAHDIRGPLARMIGLANLVSNDLITEEEMKDVVQKMAESAIELDTKVHLMSRLLEKADEGTSCVIEESSS